MIWICWILFCVLDSVVHWLVIEVFKYDPTPDGQKWWQAIPETGFRLLSFAIIYLAFKGNFIIVMAGFFCLHTLIFPVLLNVFRDKEAGYLGKAGFDFYLRKIPFKWRVWSLAVISSALIIFYYFK